MSTINPNELHPIQGQILKGLLFHPERKFSELNSESVPSDQFSFHLRRLSELNLIRKTESGYELTITGKEFANRFDTDSPKMKLERQAKLGVLITCIKEESGKMLFLIQQRLKHPFYGYHGFLTGKIKWGESIFETAKRELLEETGLKADLKLVGVEHKMDYSPAGELLEDKYFFVFRGDNPRGELMENMEGGRNFWATKEEFMKLPDLYADVESAMEKTLSPDIKVWEKKFTVERY
ncbi:MAG: NUDIX domain-containing protein [Candidatus Liptonbacteria bacterium]